jgi:glucose/arabinose dehydrogenase
MPRRVSRLVHLPLVAALALLVAPFIGAAAQPSAWDAAHFQTGYKLDPVFNDLQSPVGIVDPGDESGRLFVIEQIGLIRVIVDGAVLEAPFLDISGSVSNGSEQGLLGLAFDPGFAGNGRFYIDYTDTDGNTVVARYTLSDPAANDAGDATVDTILTQEQPHPNHNGGQLAFGPDGYLYIGFGDGGSQGDPDGNGQNLQTWLGKILRINVSGDEGYAIPPDNPFADGADGLPEIYVYGLRNPWRFTIDPETGDLFIGDVGQGAYEEMDYLPAGEAAGANLGWDILEGSSCYDATDCDSDGTVLPIFEYSHASGAGCSVIAGPAVRDPELPELDGVVVFADYCSGLLWASGRDANGEWQTADPIETGLRVSSFGTGANGEVYVVTLTGSIYRLVPHD